MDENKFDLFLARYDKDQELAKVWREKFETEQNTMKAAIAKMMIPYRLAGWVVTITGSAFLVELAKRAVEFVRSHIHYG